MSNNNNNNGALGWLTLLVTAIGIILTTVPELRCKLPGVNCPFDGASGAEGAPGGSDLSDIPGVPNIPGTPDWQQAQCNKYPRSSLQREKIIGAWQWNGSRNQTPYEVYFHLKEDATFFAQDKGIRTPSTGNWNYANDMFSMWTPGTNIAISYSIEWNGDNEFKATPIGKDVGRPSRVFRRVECRSELS